MFVVNPTSYAPDIMSSSSAQKPPTIEADRNNDGEVIMNRFRSLGVVTGAAQFASADVLSRMSVASRRTGAARPFDLVLEQRSWAGPGFAGRRECAVQDPRVRRDARTSKSAVSTRSSCRAFSVIPLSTNSRPTSAYRSPTSWRRCLAHVRQTFPSVRRIGVLTSAAIRDNGLFERYFGSAQFDVLHPRNDSGNRLRDERRVWRRGHQERPSLRAASRIAARGVRGPDRARCRD